MNTRRHRDAGLVIANRSLSVDGRERHWMEVSSTSPHDGERRLLIAVHGSNQSPGVLRSLSGYTLDDWARAGHVVVYPRSWRGGLWNDARRSTPSRARRDGVDDVAFIASLANHYLTSTGGVSGIYGIGYSNGGQLLIRVVLEARVLTAAALISATVPAPANLLIESDPEPAGAIPMMLVHGTADAIVPFGGGMARVLGRPRGLMRSFADSAAFWADRAGIDAAPVIESLAPNGPHQGGGQRWTYRADGHPPVVAYTMTGGGHLIPNRRQAGSLLMGRGNHSIDTMAEFTELVETS